MTDDIVTRLRIESASSVDVIMKLDMKCLCCPCCEESCLYCETVRELTEAADEIERLRVELKRYKDFTESAYWNMRKVLECADNVLPSPHPLWSELNEMSESVLWAERLLDIPIPYEPNHFQKQAVRGE